MKNGTIYRVTMCCILMFTAAHLAATDPNAGKIKKTIDFLRGVSKESRLSEDKVAEAQQSIKDGDTWLAILFGPNQTNNPLLDAKIWGSDAPGFVLDPVKQEIYLQKIIDIYWALFADAVQKNQGFTGGTIVVQDDNDALFKFLRNYVNMVNPEVRNKTAKVQYVSNNCFAYKRISSHFNEVKNMTGVDDSQYGIDIRPVGKKCEPSQSRLAGNKQTLLFGKADKGLTFVKAEEFGLYGTDTALHGQRYLESKVAGIAAVFGQIEKGFFQKEKVPKDVKSAWEKFLAQLPGDQKKGIIQDLKGDQELTIKYMYAVANDKGTNKNPKISTAAVKLGAYLEKNYDNLRMRRGNEVVLTRQEILGK